MLTLALSGNQAGLLGITTNMETSFATPWDPRPQCHLLQAVTSFNHQCTPLLTARLSSLKSSTFLYNACICSSGIKPINQDWEASQWRATREESR